MSHQYLIPALAKSFECLDCGASKESEEAICQACVTQVDVEVELDVDDFIVDDDDEAVTQRFRRVSSVDLRALDNPFALETRLEQLTAEDILFVA